MLWVGIYVAGVLLMTLGLHHELESKPLWSAAFILLWPLLYLALMLLFVVEAPMMLYDKLMMPPPSGR